MQATLGNAPDALERQHTRRGAQVQDMTGVDAPELARGTVVLPAEHAEAAQHALELNTKAKQARETAKAFSDQATLVLEALMAHAGEDATRILFEGSDLALDVTRKVTVKAKRDFRRKTEGAKGDGA
jgi:hypothetical protein